MTLRSVMAGLSAALVVAAAGPVSAATYDLIFVGTLSGGEDTLNLFGGDVNVGDPLSVTYRYDTSLGGTRTGDPGFYDEIDTDYGFTPAAITQVTLRLDGFSYTYTPDFQASVSIGEANFDFTSGQYDVDGAAASGQSLFGDNSAVVFQIDQDQALPTDLTDPTYFKGFGLGYFDTAYSADNTSDNFTFEFASTAVAAAPEPASWALLFGGVFFSGMTLRAGRRRSLRTV